MMKSSEIGDVLRKLKARQITAKAAIVELVAGGVGEFEAWEHVFANLGGSDVQEIGADGQARFFPSGRLVSEVEAEMDK